MRYLLILLFFPALSFSQTCWECIIASKNYESQTALDICSKVQDPSKEEREVINFVVGRLVLDKKEFTRAIYHLEKSLSSQDTLFLALVNGLIGDSYLEMKDYSNALKHYQTATNFAIHTNFEVYFLSKQGFCYSLLNNTEEHKKISSLLRFKDRFLSSPFSYNHRENCEEYDSISYIANATRLIEGPYGVGIYKGKQIELTPFIELYTELFKNAIEYGGESTYSDHKRITKYTWNHLVLKERLKQHNKGFCLSVNESEFWAYMMGEKGHNLNPVIESSFSDDEGKFRKDWLLDRIHELEKEDNSLWEETKQELVMTAQKEKLELLLSYGIYVTAYEINDFAAAQSEKLVVESLETTFENGEFVQDIDPNILRDFYLKNQFSPEYRYETERHIDIINIPFVFTEKDSSLLFNEMKILKTEFEKAASDSLFVTTHSNTKYVGYNVYHPGYETNTMISNTYPHQLQPVFNKAKKGQVVGPFWDENTMWIAKVGEPKNVLVTARHILIASQKDNKREQQLALAQSILKKVNQDNFEEYVSKYTNDPGSIETGGVYSNFYPEMMVAPFAEYCSKAKIGKIGMVETDFGFHIIEVLERKKVNYPKILVVRKELKVTQEKIEEKKQEYQVLIDKINSELKDIKVEDKLDYYSKLLNEDHQIYTFEIKEENPELDFYNEIEQQLLQFAYTSAPHTAGNAVFDEQSNQLLIPILTGVFNGKPNYEQVYESVKRHYQIALLSDSISEKMKDYTEIETIAKALGVKFFTDTYSRDHPHSYETLSKLTLYQQYFLLIPSVMNQVLNQTDVNQLFFIKSRYGLFIGKIIEKEMEPITEESLANTKEFLLGLLEQQIIQSEEVPDGKTVYNYPLFQLNLRK